MGTTDRLWLQTVQPILHLRCAQVPGAPLKSIVDAPVSLLRLRRLRNNGCLPPLYRLDVQTELNEAVAWADES